MPFPRLAVASFLLLISAGVAGAVEVQFWTQTTADDYAGAARDGTVVTNYGAVQLTRKLTPMAEGIDGASLVYDLAETGDGTVYAATGPTGVLLRVRGEKTDRYEIADAGNLLCLLVDADGSLLVGTGGETGRILRVTFEGDAAKVEPIFSEQGVRYVWKMARHADGTLYATTGGEAATLYSIGKDGKAESVFTAAGENNVESLALTDGDDVYLGTDANGLVWKVNRNDGKGSVLFDAGEPEITSLVRDGDYLYATGASRGQGVPQQQGGEVGDGLPDVNDLSSPIGRAAVDPPQAPPLPPDGPDRLPMGEMNELQEEPGGDEPMPPPPNVPKPGVAANRAAAAAQQRGPSNGFPAGDFAGDGSAIYRIDLRTNLVSGVLRDPHLFLDLARQNGQLLVAAGADEGQPARLLGFDPATQETSIVAEPDAAQISKLLPTKDGRLLLGLSNPAGVSECGKGYADEGTLESAVLDAGAVSAFGTMQLDGRVPQGTKVGVSVRGGSTEDPDVNPGGWGEWSEPVEARRYLPTNLPPARFFQYKLILQSEGGATPAVESVKIAFQPPNLPPQVSDVQVASELEGVEPGDLANGVLQGGASPSSTRAVSWQADDPNGDPLTYEVFVRKDRRGAFVKVAGDVGDAGYAWDARATGDGTYEVKVVASDATGNPAGKGLTGSRVSRPFAVDLTPPKIGDVKGGRDGDSAEVSLRVVDAGGDGAAAGILPDRRPGGPEVVDSGVPGGYDGRLPAGVVCVGARGRARRPANAPPAGGRRQRQRRLRVRRHRRGDRVEPSPSLATETFSPTSMHYPHRISKVKRARKVGFRARMRTRNGRKCINAKRRVGRKVQIV